MKPAKNFGIALMIISFGSFYNCDENNGDPVDVTPPAIEVRDPSMTEYLDAGEYAHFEATFTDDIELGSYNIEIHNNFDGHAHGRIAFVKEDPSLIRWSFNQSFPMPESAKSYVALLENEILIPENTMAGPYHFTVQAVDNAGNSTSFQDGSAIELEVYITNDSQPVIHITNHENGELEIKVDEVFVVTGDVTDPTIGEYAGMHALEVVLGEEHESEHDHSSGGRISAEDDLIDADFEEEELDGFMTDGKIILDKVFEDINFTLSQEKLDELKEEDMDHLLLTIKVFDEQGNIAVSNTEVHLE